MKWQDKGIVVAIQKYGENSLILNLFVDSSALLIEFPINPKLFATKEIVGTATSDPIDRTASIFSLAQTSKICSFSIMEIG